MRIISKVDIMSGREATSTPVLLLGLLCTPLIFHSKLIFFSEKEKTLYMFGRKELLYDK